MSASQIPAAPALCVWFARVVVSGNRWIDHRWEIVGLNVVGDAAAAADRTEDGGRRVRRPCPSLSLYRDEAEGYLLNVRAAAPSLFLMLRPDEDDDAAARAPRVTAITASFNEAARWIDAGESVERVPLPEGWATAIEAYAQANLKAPEEKRPKRRYAAAGDKHDRPGH